MKEKELRGPLPLPNPKEGGGECLVVKVDVSTLYMLANESSFATSLYSDGKAENGSTSRLRIQAPFGAQIRRISILGPFSTCYPPIEKATYGL